MRTSGSLAVGIVCLVAICPRSAAATEPKRADGELFPRERLQGRPAPPTDSPDGQPERVCAEPVA